MMERKESPPCVKRKFLLFLFLFSFLLHAHSKPCLSGTSSWKEQFTEALTVSGGDEEDTEGGSGQPSSPSAMDYLMHSLTIFWKVLFAFVPPTGA